MTQLNKQMLNKKKGFTLTELAIVIAVIAILVAVLVPTFTSILSKAKESAALQNAHNAVTTYLISDSAEETGYVLPSGSVIYDSTDASKNNVYYVYNNGEYKEISVDSTSSTTSGSDTIITITTKISLTEDTSISGSSYSAKEEISVTLSVNLSDGIDCDTAYIWLFDETCATVNT